jgi:hypothetical protein
VIFLKIKYAYGTLLENMTNVILPSIFTFLIILFFISLIPFSEEYKINDLYSSLTSILTALGGIGAAWGAFYAVEKSLAVREEDKIIAFASEQKSVYINALKYLYSNYKFFIKAFENICDLEKEKKDENDEKYKRSKEIIKDFYSNISIFRLESTIYRNPIASKFLSFINILIGPISREEDKIDEHCKFYKNKIKVKYSNKSDKYEKGYLVQIFDQLIIFLGMFVNLKNEEFISTLENQPFKKIKRKDTIELLRDNYKDQIENKYCSKNEKNFKIGTKNFKVKVIK